MEYFISVSFKTNEEQTAMLTALLLDAGFEGVEEKDNETITFIAEQHFNEETVKAIFEKFDVPYTVGKLEQQNWNAAWEHSFEPVQVDHFAAVRASFHQPVAGVLHDIIITPKMSFGTGHHATTFLMIQQMEALDFQDQYVIDFGTGTGVLAILAEKLGAKEILAIDNDDWSINNAKENLVANKCHKIILQKADEMIANKKAGIILANINLNVIIANVGIIKQACLPQTQILISGLLVQDEEHMIEILTLNGFEILQTVNKNSWIAILAHLI
ncbi:MAG TPA: 50S ribosomal protein L11 methyltransferase [Ferruginibacter sp.]|nr:50S ribosomal protein L11 methyltransferase [Ferruginibacter sp.]